MVGTLAHPGYATAAGRQATFLKIVMKILLRRQQIGLLSLCYDAKVCLGVLAPQVNSRCQIIIVKLHALHRHC